MFIANPIDLTPPKTAGPSRRLLGLVLILAGGLLHVLAVGRRRPLDTSPA